MISDVVTHETKNYFSVLFQAEIISKLFY